MAIELLMYSLSLSISENITGRSLGGRIFIFLAQVCFDSVQMTRKFCNLCENAAKYFSQDGMATRFSEKVEESLLVTSCGGNKIKTVLALLLLLKMEWVQDLVRKWRHFTCHRFPL